MTLLFTSRSRPVQGAGPAPAFWAEYKISPLSVLSFANCAPALGRGIGQAPIIAAYRRALPLLVWIYELSFFVPIITGGKPRSRFWAEYKISPLSVRIFAGQPVQVGYHSPPFRAGVGANTDPRRPLQGQAQAAPRFLRDAAHFPPASKPQPGGCRFTARRRSLQGEGAAGVSPCGRNRRRSRRARPPAGGGLPAAPPGGSARARGHSPSRSNRKSCGLVILRREQYPIRCGSTTVSSSPCRFLSAHK